VIEKHDRLAELGPGRGKSSGLLARYRNVQPHKTEFQEFYLASHERCLRAVIAGTGSVDLAEDLVAEAFTRALMSWRTVRVHPAPEAWVVRTALNVRVSWWRRRRREVPIDDHGTGTLDRLTALEPNWGSDPELDPVLLAALARLSVRQREVIALRVFLDLDIATTARLLRIAPGTVGAHLSRAVAALRSHVELARSQQSQRPPAIEQEIAK
jgi:RNA polymerase sigma factor (sigma-70 family)